MIGKLTDIRDLVRVMKFLPIDGWWMLGQTMIFATGGCTRR